MCGNVGGRVLGHSDGVEHLQSWSNLRHHPGDLGCSTPGTQESLLEGGPTGHHLRGDVGEHLNPTGAGHHAQRHRKLVLRGGTDLDVVHLVWAVALGEIVEETGKNDLLARVGRVWVDGTDERD